jgi:photosystem II stability/assembly factor-like uncharacterized protein
VGLATPIGTTALWDVAFSSATTGIAIGASGRVFRTTDSGTT